MCVTRYQCNVPVCARVAGGGPSPADCSHCKARQTPPPGGGRGSARKGCLPWLAHPGPIHVRWVGSPSHPVPRRQWRRSGNAAAGHVAAADLCSGCMADATRGGPHLRRGAEAAAVAAGGSAQDGTCGRWRGCVGGGAEAAKVCVGGCQMRMACVGGGSRSACSTCSAPLPRGNPFFSEVVGGVDGLV